MGKKFKNTFEKESSRPFQKMRVLAPTDVLCGGLYVKGACLENEDVNSALQSCTSIEALF